MPPRGSWLASCQGRLVRNGRAQVSAAFLAGMGFSMSEGGAAGGASAVAQSDDGASECGSEAAAVAGSAISAARSRRGAGGLTAAALEAHTSPSQVGAPSNISSPPTIINWVGALPATAPAVVDKSRGVPNR